MLARRSLLLIASSCHGVRQQLGYVFDAKKTRFQMQKWRLRSGLICAELLGRDVQQDALFLTAVVVAEQDATDLSR